MADQLIHRLGGTAGRQRSQRGLSLIELMIAMAIGLVLVAVILRSYSASSSTTRVNSQVSEYQTNGRYALEVLKRELRHAALHPLVWESAQVVPNESAAAANFGCGAGVTTDVMAGIAVWNDSNPYSATCLTTSATRQYARGDVLLLRRAGADVATALDAGAPYLRVGYSSGNVFLGGDVPDNVLPPTFDHRLVSDVYFINDFTASSTENPKVPALYRLTLSSGANPTMVPELVASNIEHFQMQLGEVDSDGSIRYRNPDAVVNWTQVVSARIWLLLRASDPEAGFASGSYVMGDVTYTPADRFRRTVLTSTINLRNQ